MQPTDQDELRRQAQRALTRRIGSDTNQQAAPPRPQQPAQRQQPSQRPQANANRQRQLRDEQQLRELQERRQRQQQQAPPVVEVEVRGSEIHADIHRDIHADTHAGVHESRHQNIHAGAYARADATRRRSQIYRDLRDPEARKRAIVMAEILGKPVALREHEGNTT